MKHIHYLLIAVVALSITSCKEYHLNQGSIFGTYYNIQYQSYSDKQEKIEICLHAFDSSLSMYNQQSIISRINRNEDVETDAYFECMLENATYVSEKSEGGFDITVAPLVNAWGFGFQHKQNMDSSRIDSILQLVGYTKIHLENHHLIKDDPRIMLDASALAKGYACDVIAEMLEKEGCSNYLVDIGGEVVAKGHNRHHKAWMIGITKPIDDISGERKELQDAINTTSICMATSGNYRNYYIEDGVRRSHTIDPHTGLPVHHKLLSATIVAPSCIKADALATACMVLGEYNAAVMISQIPETGYYFILTDEKGNYITKTSANWEKLTQGKN